MKRTFKLLAFTVGALLGGFFLAGITGISTHAQALLYQWKILADGSGLVTIANPAQGTNAATAVYMRGFPLWKTNLQFAVTPGVVTNGAALVLSLEIDNITSNTNDSAMVLCAQYLCNTNCSATADLVKIAANFYKMPPTLLGANGLVNFTYDDNTNYLGTIYFTNWVRLGTNSSCIASLQPFGLSWCTNYVVLTANSTWTNCAGSPKDSLILTFQRPY